MIILLQKNRPDVLRKEGNIYYFDWSERQHEEYFKKFGKHALILEPEFLKENMKIFYQKAIDSYKNL